MDYGIGGKRALVCASSKGLGKGCAMALAEAGVNLVVNARNAEALEQTVGELRDRAKVNVRAVAADITTTEGRAKVLEVCPDPDILITNAGGPPPGDFHDWNRETWIRALDANMLAPIELIRATVDGMIARRFGRVVNITSGAVKAPIANLGLSNGARTGLTGFVAGLSRAIAHHNVTVNNLLPGAFDTERRSSIIAAIAKATGKTPEEVRKEQIEQTPAKRFGSIEEFGAACAFLCSQQAGFVTGQNLLLDGGAFPGTL